MLELWSLRTTNRTLIDWSGRSSVDHAHAGTGNTFGTLLTWPSLAVRRRSSVGRIRFLKQRTLTQRELRGPHEIIASGVPSSRALRVYLDQSILTTDV